jgi:hypothetical protein
MKRTFAAALTVAALSVLAATVQAQQNAGTQAPPKSAGATKDPRILAYDKGPTKINVSKYPDDMKARYKVFDKRCGACHTIARAVNCDYALDEEWQHYIRQMMDRGGSLISPEDAKEIFAFVTYDSKTRKKALYEKKLAAGTN